MVLAVLVAASTAGCGWISHVTGPDFDEGDCVKIDEGVVSSDMESADCDDAQGTMDGSQRIYRVEHRLNGTSATCPAPQGFFPVQFVDEPDDVTYCLVQADGSEGASAPSGDSSDTTEFTGDGAPPEETRRSLCEAGNLYECDRLRLYAESGSDDYEFGDTCGGQTDEVAHWCSKQMYDELGGEPGGWNDPLN
jgi:hypothetical protein